MAIHPDVKGLQAVGACSLIGRSLVPPPTRVGLRLPFAN
jgi:hypothetical protein